jgi:hypothetical protein
MVGAQLVWGALSGNGGVEHPTEGDTIDIPCMPTEANEAPRELVHDDEYPLGVEYNGLATKKINAS